MNQWIPQGFSISSTIRICNELIYFSVEFGLPDVFDDGKIKFVVGLDPASNQVAIIELGNLEDGSGLFASDAVVVKLPGRPYADAKSAWSSEYDLIAGTLTHFIYVGGTYWHDGATI
jgi:hypothetical protein